MAVNIGQIKNPSINIKPSEALKKFLSKVKISDDIPVNVKKFIFKNKTKEFLSEDTVLESKKLEYLTTEQDEEFIRSLNFKTTKIKEPTKLLFESEIEIKDDRILNLQDLHWIYQYIQTENQNNEEKIYLHTLLEGSQIVLPKNVEIPRNEELEKRCNRLRIQQQNRDYEKMTKNVDNLRKRLPEDTIGYQLRQLNRQLIAIAQFIITVIAGFAFGFIGVELIIGGLDFGFRLLLGIICALVIALAELYFLAKRLNEDLQFEYTAASKDKTRLQKSVKQD